jgi:hypothetical protein
MFNEWSIVMTTIKPPSGPTSQSSPGQPENRDLLIRIYDELSDTGKQELLRLAQELFTRR